jgi:HSP20 family protein
MANEKKPAQDKERRKSELTASMSPFDELERMFGNFAPRGWLRPFHWDLPGWAEMMGTEGKLPRVDVVDQEDTLLVRAELPGVSKDDIDVLLSDNLLTISSQTRKETTKEVKGKFQRREIYQGNFSRSLTLPVDVDGDKAAASFKDGILELRFPKAPQAKRRSITID